RQSPIVACRQQHNLACMHRMLRKGARIMPQKSAALGTTLLILSGVLCFPTLVFVREAQAAIDPVEVRAVLYAVDALERSRSSNDYILVLAMAAANRLPDVEARQALPKLVQTLSVNAPRLNRSIAHADIDPDALFSLVASLRETVSETT